MNEFTKEELKEILWRLTTKTVISVGNDLVPKIQRMIESYCEHENTENIGGWCYKCTKCGMKFGDERY
jgi:hypothetical protein